MKNGFSAKAVLLAGLRDGCAYGVELEERIKRKSGGAVEIGGGGLYPGLRSLEEEGLVRSWEAHKSPEQGGRPRRYYQLTAEGEAMAQEHRALVAALFSL